MATLALSAGLLTGGAARAGDPALLAAPVPPPTDAVGLPAGEPVELLPVTVAVDPRLADLGRHLFFDTRLSADHGVSCANCHDVGRGGSDGLPLAKGPSGLRPFNTPTIFNTALHARYGWTGHTKSLTQQVAHAVEEEMAGSWPEIASRLHQDPVYTRLAPQGLNQDRMKAALAAYVATLVTPDSPFDRWLGGDASAIGEEAQRGYALFKSYGCASCHQGRAIGGTMMQKVGLFRSFFPRRSAVPQSDLGRFAVSGREEDRHAFKVPSLRNVAETAPYLHDGSIQTLEGVVRVMAYYQLGRSLSDQDVAAISAFLRTLTGRPPGTARPPVREPAS